MPQIKNFERISVIIIQNQWIIFIRNYKRFLWRWNQVQYVLKIQ